MLTSQRIKFIRSLQQKKYRSQEMLFVAEGSKLVQEILRSSLRVNHIYYTDGFDSYSLPQNLDSEQITNKEMGRISGLKTHTDVLAIIAIPEQQFDIDDLQNQLTLCLDDIQDPGNLGTIIRLAHWFGVESIVCSPNTVDAYSPKVVQATMGAIAGVKVHYAPLGGVISEAKEIGIPVMGTFLNGESIYTTKLSQAGIVVLGNEGKGISSELAQLIPLKISIPSFSDSNVGSESLNVSMAAAIVCSEIRRRSL